MLAVPSSGGLLRDLAEVHLRKWGLGELADDVLLVVSELATNAIAASPGTLIGFRMMRWLAMIAVEVQDSSTERVVRREPMTLDESGRGLWIVEQIARHWGQRAEPDGTKTVYALLDLP
ncbi:ATP-binding protein [Actinomadura sp. 9N407]|uniref:ATP-binding protein n=1 Tax=Actinomadura sp. 9N407 TaxID=3375154 RepID=UPI0037B6A3A4